MEGVHDAEDAIVEEDDRGFEGDGGAEVEDLNREEDIDLQNFVLLFH